MILNVYVIIRRRFAAAFLPRLSGNYIPGHTTKQYPVLCMNSGDATYDIIECAFKWSYMVSNISSQFCDL